jgi:hypothetical protein
VFRVVLGKWGIGIRTGFMSRLACSGIGWPAFVLKYGKRLVFLNEWDGMAKMELGDIFLHNLGEVV